MTHERANTFLDGYGEKAIDLSTLRELLATLGYVAGELPAPTDPKGYTPAQVRSILGRLSSGRGDGYQHRAVTR